MKVGYTLLILQITIIYLGYVVASDCPDPKQIEPCKCLKTLQGTPDLICIGTEITDLSHINFTTIYHYHKRFLNLVISNTSIETLTKNMISDVYYQHLHIINNLKLSNINFNNTYISSRDNLVDIHLINSPLITSSYDVFYLVSQLKPWNQITIQNVNIDHIPDFAFTENGHLYSLTITNTSVKSIGSYAFEKLVKLQKLNLKYNMISKIPSNGFTFNLASTVRQLEISLDHNQLNENSFDDNWINNRQVYDTTKIIINLNHNKLTTLPESSFSSVLNDPMIKYVSVYGNDFTCDCWVMYLLSNMAQFNHKVSYMYCKNSVNAPRDLHKHIEAYIC